MVHLTARYDDAPTAVRYPRGCGDDRLPEARTPIQLGRAEVLGVNGDVADGAPEVLLLALGSMVSPAWEASALLAARGTRATVINSRFVKPLDVDTIVSHARQAGRIVTLEENVRIGGFGQQVRDALHTARLGHLPHTILALPDEFVEHGTQSILRAQCGLDAEGIVRAASKLVEDPARS